MPAPYAPSARIGHVHLKVADLDRAIAFYADVLGFEVQTRLGNDAAFLGSDGYHHPGPYTHLTRPPRALT